MARGNKPVIVAIAAIDDLALRHTLGDTHEGIDIIACKLVRCRGAQHRVGQVPAGGRAHRFPIEGSPFTNPARPAFHCDGLVYDAQHRPAILQQGNQRTENRSPGDEAGGPVNRIEDPLPPCGFVAGAIFLADYAIIDPFGLEDLAHRCFCSAICFSHKSPVRLLFL